MNKFNVKILGTVEITSPTDDLTPEEAEKIALRDYGHILVDAQVQALITSEENLRALSLQYGISEEEMDGFIESGKFAETISRSKFVNMPVKHLKDIVDAVVDIRSLAKDKLWKG